MRTAQCSGMCLPLRDKDMGDRDRQIPRSAQVSLVCVVEFLTVGVTACCCDKISQKSNSVKGGMVWLAVHSILAGKAWQQEVAVTLYT